MARRAEKYREMNHNELEIRQQELSEQIFRLRFQLSTGQAEGLKKLREAKRDFARVKTASARERIEEGVMANEAAAVQQSGIGGAWIAAGTGRRGDQREDAEDDRGEGHARYRSIRCISEWFAPARNTTRTMKQAMRAWAMWCELFPRGRFRS